MPSRTSRVRRLLAGAALATMAVATVGCSSSDSGSGAGATPAPGAADSTTVAPASTISSSIDTVATLKAAVAQLAAGYHFSSTFVVNGQATLTAVGDRVGDSSRLDITSKGATVSYIVTPAASYALPDSGEWEQLDQPPAATDPIQSLASPSAIGVLADDGTTMKLRVTVSAVALGVGTDGTADLEVTITGGAITAIGYSAPVEGGGVASVATTIGPLTDTTPISAPI